MTGFKGNRIADFCSVIDECYNTIGAGECSYDEGYLGTDASVACDKINECENDPAINLSVSSMNAIQMQLEVIRMVITLVLVTLHMKVIN